MRRCRRSASQSFGSKNPEGEEEEEEEEEG